MNNETILEIIKMHFSEIFATLGLLISGKWIWEWMKAKKELKKIHEETESISIDNEEKKFLFFTNQIESLQKIIVELQDKTKQLILENTELEIKISKQKTELDRQERKIKIMENKITELKQKLSNCLDELNEK